MENMSRGDFHCAQDREGFCQVLRSKADGEGRGRVAGKWMVLCKVGLSWLSFLLTGLGCVTVLHRLFVVIPQSERSPPGTSTQVQIAPLGLLQHIWAKGQSFPLPWAGTGAHALDVCLPAGLFHPKLGLCC